jgi:predicted NAD-dependent protein-ADP-ribosyltransferase YbiA (DUF1768 family)
MTIKKPELYYENQPPKDQNGLYDYVIQDENKICGFFGKEGFFLSNGKKRKIPDAFDTELIYSYSENAYQSSKFADIEIRKLFCNITFIEAINLAWEKRDKIKTNWEEIKLFEMERVLKLKFTDSDLRLRLVETEEKYLEETNHWGDVFWGVCNGVGENNLGKILMKIRNDLNL